MGNLRPARDSKAARVWLGRNTSFSSTKIVLLHFINNQDLMIEKLAFQRKNQISSNRKHQKKLVNRQTTLFSRM